MSASKQRLTFVFILSAFFCSAQVPIAEIEGLLSVYLPDDTTSLHIGRNGGVSQSFGDNYNTVVGSEAGGNSNQFDYSSFYGFRAGFYAGRDDNSFFGAFAGENTGIISGSGSTNSFFGTEAGRLNENGSENCFFGNECGYNNTSGDSNSLFGTWSGYSNNGNNNSYFGYEAGEDGTTGNYNSFFGSNSGTRTNGNYNNFFGYRAGNNVDDGAHNVAIGAFSFHSGFQNNNGSYNAAVGDSTMYFLDTHAELSGERNVAVGAGSLMARIDKGSNRSVALGYHAGYDGGHRSIFIGNEAGEGASERDDVLYIDNRKGDDPLIYGEFDNNIVRIHGRLDTENGTMFMRNLGNNDTNQGVKWGESNDDPAFGITYDGDGFEGENRLHIREYIDNSQSDLMTIKADGNVGIGIDNPESKLDINGIIHLRATMAQSGDCASVADYGKIAFDTSVNKLSVCADSDAIAGGDQPGWVKLH
jgi:hypothetical protein